MRVSKVTYSFTKKYNLQNYESVELAAFLVGEVEEGEDEAMVIEYLHDTCKDSIYAHGKLILQEHGLTPKTPIVHQQDMYYGKPMGDKKALTPVVTGEKVYDDLGRDPADLPF